MLKENRRTIFTMSTVKRTLYCYPVMPPAHLLDLYKKPNMNHIHLSAG